MDRDASILLERLGGLTLAEIGARHALTAEGVRLVVVREGRRQIDELERRLDENRLAGAGDLEVFLVPDHSGPDFDIAVEYFQWCLRELAARGVSTRVHYRPVASGVAFGVEDVTDYGGQR